ncbi:MAG: peptide-methionine (R)-S-oxide reductase MsrB [Saprospiraceae bacterium]
MKRFSIVLLAFAACGQVANTHSESVEKPDASNAVVAQADTLNPDQDPTHALKLSDEEWRNRLSKQAYYVLREEGTERAFTGTYWDNHAKGVYACRGCGLVLFDSQTKFDSGTGWPSFYKPSEANHVKENVDSTYGMVRTEVECARCGGHLGHVFDDGPAPTGLRYCINSVSLEFIEQE